MWWSLSWCMTMWNPWMVVCHNQDLRPVTLKKIKIKTQVNHTKSNKCCLSHFSKNYLKWEIVVLSLLWEYYHPKFFKLQQLVKCYVENVFNVCRGFHIDRQYTDSLMDLMSILFILGNVVKSENHKSSRILFRQWLK